MEHEIKGKSVLMHSTKKHRSVGIAPLIPDFDTGWGRGEWSGSRSDRFTSSLEMALVPTDGRLGGSQGLSGNFENIKISCPLPEFEQPRTVTVPITLLRPGT